MSSIALVSVAGSAPTLLSLLKTAGHSVTEMKIADTPSKHLETYELVMVSDWLGDGTGGPAATAINNAFNAGVPVIIGSSVSQNFSNNPGVLMKLTGGSAGSDLNNAQWTTLRAVKDDPIFQNVGIAVPSNTTVCTFGNAIINYESVASTSVRSILGTVTAVGVPPAMIIALKGDITSSGTPFPANACFFSWLAPLGQAYSNIRRDLIIQIVNRVLGFQYQLRGTVRSGDGKPLARRIRLYNDDATVLYLETESDPASGAWQATTTRLPPYVAVCLEDDGGTHPSLIKTNLSADLIQVS